MNFYQNFDKILNKPCLSFKNTYTFYKDDHKIILAPMKPTMALETKLEVKGSLLSKSKLEKEIKVGLDVMALVFIEETENKKEIL